MAKCPKCGAQAADDAKFCPTCGTTLAPANSGSSVSSSTAAPPSARTTGGQGGMAPNVAALLVYVPVCFIGIVCSILFAFVLEPYKSNRYVRFHAWQSLALHVCLFGFGMACWIMVVVLAAVIHFFAILFIPVYFIMVVGGLALTVFMMVKANGMETYKLPIIGDWAEKQANS